MTQNSLFEFTQKLARRLEDRESIYVPLGFRSNPFPSLPIPPDPPTILVDQEPVQDALIDAINRASEAQKCSALLLVSFAGDGKSHVLKFLENGINKSHGINKSLRSERRAFAIYVEEPGRSLLDICRSFITRPHIEFWQKVLLRVVDEKLSMLDRVAKVYFDAPEYMFSEEELLNQRTQPISESTLEQFEETQLDRILDRLEMHFYREITKNSDFARTLSRLLDPNNSATAWKFLTTNKLSRDEAKELGISTPAIADTAAVDYLTSLLRLLLNIYQVGLIFIDELETVKGRHPTTKKKLYLDLRKLLDNLPGATVVVFTCDSAAYREIYIEASPLTRRFTEVLTIWSIKNTTEAERYITEYLESVRIELAGEDRALFPFTPEVAKAVFEKVSRQQKRCEVGRFLVTCHFLFEGWAEKGNKDMPVTEADVEAIGVSSHPGG